MQRQGAQIARQRQEAGVGILIRALAFLTILVLSYVLTSVLNATGEFRPEQVSFEYFQYWKWLPHSLDRRRTLFTFWQLLALACSFFALRDWLVGKTDAEIRAERKEQRTAERTARVLFPDRLRLLLWVLAINGALVGAEAIVQRLEGSGRLLFIVKPKVNPDAVSQFGPYAYRANAASFFNLIWPVCVGFWWTLQRYTGRMRASSHLLLFCALIMAACPIITTSRGGAIVTLMLIIGGLLFLAGSTLLMHGTRASRKKAGLVIWGFLIVFAAGAIGLGISLGWNSLKPRLEQMGEHYELREEMYKRAMPMARDYPMFGTGAGTFDSVFQLYRFSTDTYWPEQLHNDWLETRITYGGIGFLLIMGALVLVLLRWFLPGGGIHGGRRFVGMIWIALAGCLIHARWDFPFQIYSILFLFLALCAVLSVLTRRA
jgi:hypothetical protein